MQDLAELKIVSGGQTGVDRVALDVAIEHGIEHGGWCPRGRIAEDGVLDERYHLHETRSAAYSERTLRNVIDSDATVIFSDRDALTGGTALTARLTARENKALLVLLPDLPVEQASLELAAFLQSECVGILNVAGPRAGLSNGYLMDYVRAVLTALFSEAIGRSVEP